MYLRHQWVIDWENIKTKNDIIAVLKAVEDYNDISFDRPPEGTKQVFKLIDRETKQEVDPKTLKPLLSE